MFTKEEHKQNIRELKNFLKKDLARYREEKGFSLEEAAKQSHIPIEELCRIECYQEINMGTIYQLARFFDKKVRIMFY